MQTNTCRWNLAMGVAVRYPEVRRRASAAGNAREHFLREDQLLHLARALVDPQRAHLAEQPLDRGAALHAEAAEVLHRAVADPARALGREELRARDLRRRRAAEVAGLRRLAHERLGRGE